MRCYCGGPEEAVYGHEKGAGRYCKGENVSSMSREEIEAKLNEAHAARLSFDALTEEASAAFFASMRERHEKGEKKYGPLKFMEADTLVEAMEEVVDLANYALYTYLKLYILQKQIQNIVGDQPEALGDAGFIPSGGKS